MVRRSFMLIAGEPSGDLLGAELVRALRQDLVQRDALPSDDRQPLHASLVPEFFGAGGPNMAAAGVQLAFDLTQHAVTGLSEVIRNYPKFRRLFHQLLALAKRRLPDAIICIDFSGFNLRFARALRRYARSLRGSFANWDPFLVQYVSPQVWASRPERARRLAQDADLLLSIVPFEKEWYSQRVPNLPVVFVGHPVVDRYASLQLPGSLTAKESPSARPQLLLLPGSRAGEIQRHLPIMIEALARIRSTKPGVRARAILPNKELLALAQAQPLPPDLEMQAGGLTDALRSADLAIASTGTVTLECAWFGLPTVALYRTSWATYMMGKQMVRVKHLAMPNLLAGEELMPEFIQDAATPENLSRATLALLDHPENYRRVRAKLLETAAALGTPGASRRAARAIIDRLHAHSLRASLARNS